MLRHLSVKIYNFIVKNKIKSTESSGEVLTIANLKRRDTKEKNSSMTVDITMNAIVRVHDDEFTDESNEICVSTKNWDYFMRREKQQIVTGIFLGPYRSAMKSKKQELINDGITHIICVRHSQESKYISANFPEQFEYLVLDVADTADQSIIPYFTKVTEFIDNCLRRNGQVLVHGNAGISRSATLVIAYLMEKEKISAKQATKVVQRKRFCVHPNLGFQRQLIEYEPIVWAKQSYPSTGSVKRTIICIEDDDEVDDETISNENLENESEEMIIC